MFAQQSDGVRPGFAGVNGDGQVRLAGDLQLAGEDRALRLARGEIVVVVETDFGNRDHLGVRGQRDQILPGRLVALDASCGWTPTVAYMKSCFSASRMPALKSGGPSPLPMATMISTRRRRGARP
jgi:hypothetical protein